MAAAPPNRIVLYVVALLPILSIGRGVLALWQGESWTAPKLSPPILLTGMPAYLSGAIHICLGLFIAAAMAPSFGAPRRTSIAAAVTALLGVFLFGAISIFAH